MLKNQESKTYIVDGLKYYRDVSIVQRSDNSQTAEKYPGGLIICEMEQANMRRINEETDDSEYEKIFLRKAMQIVEDNISNPEFNVNMMSREIGVSRAALYRKLKAHTNQSVNVFVRNIRLKRAAQLLAQNTVSISEVAYMVGYNDVQYFRKCFIKHFNATPSQYIDKYRQE